VARRRDLRSVRLYRPARYYRKRVRTRQLRGRRRDTGAHPDALVARSILRLACRYDVRIRRGCGRSILAANVVRDKRQPRAGMSADERATAALVARRRPRIRVARRPTFAANVSGPPCLIQGPFGMTNQNATGNFELCVALNDGGSHGSRRRRFRLVRRSEAAWTKRLYCVADTMAGMPTAAAGATARAGPAATRGLPAHDPCGEVAGSGFGHRRSEGGR